MIGKKTVRPEVLEGTNGAQDRNELADDREIKV
jgi:hypothetical protein